MFTCTVVKYVICFWISDSSIRLSRRVNELSTPPPNSGPQKQVSSMWQQSRLTKGNSKLHPLTFIIELLHNFEANLWISYLCKLTKWETVLKFCQKPLNSVCREHQYREFEILMYSIEVTHDVTSTLSSFMKRVMNFELRLKLQGHDNSN